MFNFNNIPQLNNPETKPDEENLATVAPENFDELPEVSRESFAKFEQDIDNNSANVQEKLDLLSKSAPITESNEGNRVDKLLNEQKKIRLEKKTVLDIKSSIPESVLKRFDVGEILRHSREKFITSVKNADLRTLIGYVEAGGIELKKIKEIISREQAEKIDDIKQQQDSFITINPKLFFLSKRRAAEIALEEILTRLAEN